jgi:hypothetical protein
MGHPRTYLALAVLAAAPSFARADEDKSRPEDNEVQVQLANGSSVRLAVLHERIDVVTRYGPLAVPLKDIHKIDFGVRLPPAIERKVEAAVARLGSAQYTDRDGAERELLALGAHAYPAVKRAARHMDKEVARRAERLLATLREKLPDKELRDREDDIISTPGFTIVGRIAPASLKVHSEYFGAGQLHLAQLRQLRALRVSGDTEVAVDAARWGSVHGQWLDTGFYCDPSVSLTIKATGSVDLYPQTPGQYMSGPNGMQAGNNAAGGVVVGRVGQQVVVNARNQQSLAGALLGRVGDGGAPFLIGDTYEGSPGEGRLHLHIVPSPWNNASTGTYQVKITPRP